MRRQVKSRLVHYYVDTVIPIPAGETILTERLAYQGQWLNSGPGTDTETERYNVREPDFAKLEADGHLSKEEVNFPAWQDDTEEDDESAGLEPFITVDGDVIPATGEVEPLTFNQLAEWQIEEVLKGGMPVSEILDAIEASEDPKDAATKVLEAERSLTGGTPRDDLVLGIAARLGSGEAVQSPPDTSDEQGASAPGGTPPIEGEPPTEAVLAYVQDNNIDLSQVEGTGKGGRITMNDVARYEKSQKS